MQTLKSPLTFCYVLIFSQSSLQISIQHKIVLVMTPNMIMLEKKYLRPYPRQSYSNHYGFWPE